MIDFFKKLFGTKPATVSTPAPYKIETPPEVKEDVKVEIAPAETAPKSSAKKPSNGNRARKPRTGAAPVAPAAKKT